MGSGAGRLYGGFDEGPITAERVDVNYAVFGNVLSAADDTVQKALETLDAMDGSFDITTTGDIILGILYFGPSGTNGSWRLFRSGNNLLVQRREAGVWVEKGGFLP